MLPVCSHAPVLSCVPEPALPTGLGLLTQISLQVVSLWMASSCSESSHVTHQDASDAYLKV